jgi:hypothetical protein
MFPPSESFVPMSTAFIRKYTFEGLVELDGVDDIPLLTKLGVLPPLLGSRMR